MFGNTPESANFWFDISNVVLFAGAVAVAVGTYGVIKTGAAKENFANERISSNELETKRAIAESDKAKAAAADANARASEANQKAEEERLARVKIEQRLAPRVLTPQQIADLISTLSKTNHAPVDMFVAGQTKETEDIASVIAEALNQSGWSCMSWAWTGVGGVAGVSILVRSGASPATIASTNALSSALASAGVVVTSQYWPDDWEHFGGMLNGAAFDANRASIRLVVGHKPD